MNEIFEIIIASLRSVLCADVNALKNIGELDEIVLKEVYKLSKKHDMAHLVGYALDREHLLESFTKLKEKFVNEQYLAVYRYENIKYEIDRISTLFDKELIPYVKLKGAVIRELYPEPWMRTSCDIDILVHEEMLDKAVNALVDNLNYRQEGEKRFHDFWLYSESGVHLELHFSVKETIPQLDRVLERIWDYTNNTGAPCTELTNEFLMYHAIAHAAYHFIGGGCGIRPFVDLYLLRTKLDFDEQTVLCLCRESDIERFYLSALSLINSWFDHGEKGEEIQRIEEFILCGGTYGTQNAKIAVRREARGGKIGYALSRIFVPYEILTQRYPKLKSRALIPIYQVRRWIDVICEGKGKKAFEELKLNNSLADESVDKAVSLMKLLELDKHIK